MHSNKDTAQQSDFYMDTLLNYVSSPCTKSPELTFVPQSDANISEATQRRVEPANNEPPKDTFYCAVCEHNYVRVTKNVCPNCYRLCACTKIFATIDEKCSNCDIYCKSEIVTCTEHKKLAFDTSLFTQRAAINKNYACPVDGCGKLLRKPCELCGKVMNKDSIATHIEESCPNNPNSKKKARTSFKKRSRSNTAIENDEPQPKFPKVSKFSKIAALRFNGESTPMLFEVRNYTMPQMTIAEFHQEEDAKLLFTLWKSQSLFGEGFIQLTNEEIKYNITRVEFASSMTCNVYVKIEPYKTDVAVNATLCIRQNEGEYPITSVAHFKLMPATLKAGAEPADYSSDSDSDIRKPAECDDVQSYRNYICNYNVLAETRTENTHTAYFPNIPFAVNAETLSENEELVITTFAVVQ